MSIQEWMRQLNDSMKKVFILLILTIASITVNAQVYLGGTLGIGVVNASYDGESETSTSFVFSPEVGYNFNSIWAVGATVGVQYQNPLDVVTLKVLPYVRATFARANIFDFFGEIALGYGYQYTDGFGYNGFIAGLRPGFVAHINDKFGIVGKTTLLEYNHFDGINGIGFSINNGFEIGVQFTL